MGRDDIPRLAVKMRGQRSPSTSVVANRLQLN